MAAWHCKVPKARIARGGKDGGVVGSEDKRRRGDKQKADDRHEHFHF